MQLHSARSFLRYHQRPPRKPTLSCSADRHPQLRRRLKRLPSAHLTRLPETTLLSSAHPPPQQERRLMRLPKTNSTRTPTRPPTPPSPATLVRPTALLHPLLPEQVHPYHHAIRSLQRRGETVLQKQTRLFHHGLQRSSIVRTSTNHIARRKQGFQKMGRRPVVGRGSVGRLFACFVSKLRSFTGLRRANQMEHCCL